MSEPVRLRERPLEELRPGEGAAFEYTVHDEDLDTFAGLSGDRSPLHLDEAFARTTRYGGRVAHGMLVAAPVSTLVGMCLPGRNAIFAGVRLDFTAPVRPGDRLRLAGTVRSVSTATRMILLDVEVRRVADERTVVRGEARVLVEPPAAGTEPLAGE